MNNLKLGINETSLWTFLMWLKGETALLAGMEQQGSCRRNSSRCQVSTKAVVWQKAVCVVQQV